MSATPDMKEWLRPSMLPKLAQCGHYRPEADAGEAAARGTKLDEAFREDVSSAEDFNDDDFASEADAEQACEAIASPVRELIAGNNVSVAGLDADDREAIQWAFDTARALAGGNPLEAKEASLRVASIAGIREGTADLLCADAMWSADLKTGMKRNYVEQQAAYAFGFMQAHFVEEWTVYLLYCDRREVETLRFTLESAEGLIRNAKANARGDTPPALNEYCGWCARRFQCPVRRESLGIVPIDGPGALTLNDLTTIQLRDFTIRAKVVEDFKKEARKILLERATKGDKPAGVSVVNRTGSRVLAAQFIEPYWKQIGTAKIVALLGNVSEAKAKPLFDGSGVEFPADKVEQLPGSSFVRVTRPKGDK